MPMRWRLDVNNNLIPTADNIAHPAGFRDFTVRITYLFVLNLSRILYTTETKINEGIIIADVAINAPKIPAVVKPENVAIFTPTGPGVIDDIAIISVS